MHLRHLPRAPALGALALLAACATPPSLDAPEQVNALLEAFLAGAR